MATKKHPRVFDPIALREQDAGSMVFSEDDVRKHITAALNSGRRCSIIAGKTFAISELTVPAALVGFEFSAAPGVVILLGAGAAATTLFTVACSRAFIHDITFQNESASAQRLIRLSGANATVDNVRFTRRSSTLQTPNPIAVSAAHPTISRVVADDGWDSPFIEALPGATEVRVSDCSAYALSFYRDSSAGTAAESVIRDCIFRELSAASPSESPVAFDSVLCTLDNFYQLAAGGTNNDVRVNANGGSCSFVACTVGGITTSGSLGNNRITGTVAGAALTLHTTDVVADMYSRVQSSGTAQNRRTNLNFTGAGVAVADDAANDRTTVTIAGGGGGGGANAGQATIDFGAFPGASDASVAVTGQAGIVASSVVMAKLLGVATADHSADEHAVETIEVVAKDIVAGTGFTLLARNTNQVNEPLEKVKGAANATLSGSLGAPQGLQQNTGGGKGTRLYGQWTVGWMWA